MAASFPSGTNTFVPSHEASGGLVIAYGRNVKDFPLNSYIKQIPVKKSVGYYLQVTAEEAARVINTNLEDFYWPDGQEADIGAGNTESFQFAKFATRRYQYPYTLGQKAVEQADWQIEVLHGKFAAQKAMTARTIAAQTVLSTSGNWGGNTNTTAGLGYGYLDQSTTGVNWIKNTFESIAEVILQATIGAIRLTDVFAVMNPHTARIISTSQEIVDFLKQSPFAYAQVRGDVPSQNGTWGLPDVLFGVKIVVEDTVVVTSKKGATRATGYACPNQVIEFVGRPGGLMGIEGVPEFSTVQQFNYEEMTAWKKDDPDNRRALGRIVDDFDTQLVASASGFLLTGATST